MTKPYKHKLTKKQLAHLKEFNIVNMVGIKRQMERLVKDRKTTEFEPCYECKGIALKLGLPV